VGAGGIDKSSGHVAASLLQFSSCGDCYNCWGGSFKEIELSRLSYAKLATFSRTFSDDGIFDPACWGLGCPPPFTLSTPHTREYIDWRWPLSRVHSMIMISAAQLVEGGVSRPPPLHSIYPLYSSYHPLSTPSLAKLARDSSYLYSGILPLSLLSGFHRRHGTGLFVHIWVRFSFFSVDFPPRIYQVRESVSWTLYVTEHKTSNGTKLYKRLQGQESILKQSKHASIAGKCRVQVHDQKPNSWMYNHVEVSGHNQTLGFCMDFLSHGEGGMVFYQVFLLSPLQKL
jgi:hypothetical protein